MKNIKVLGSGCKKCNLTLEAIRAQADKLGAQIELEKVEDYAQIASFGVMATPSVVLDGVVVHSGGIPGPAQIESWLR